MKCHIDKIVNTKKPTNSEIKLLNKRITNSIEMVTVNEFIKYINLGYTFLPSLMQDSRKQANFIQTELLFLDFDNAEKLNGEYIKKANYLKLEDCLALEYTKNNALLAYETFTSNEEINRFRLVFRLSKAIQTVEDFKAYYEKLLTIYPQADRNCNDCSRIFFGGKNATIINSENTLDLDILAKIKIASGSSKIAKNKIIPNTINYPYNSNILLNLINADITNLREYLNENKLILEQTYQNDKRLIKAFNKLNMFLLFGLPSESFTCILYPEKIASCSIMLLDNGDYIYKRFSEKKPLAMNNFQLLREILNFSYEDCLSYVKTLFNIKIEERDLADKKIKDFLSQISNKDLKKTHKHTSKIFYKYRNVIEGLFSVMFSKPSYKRLSNGQHEYQYISTFGTRTLAERVLGAEPSTLDTKRKRINNLLLRLAYVGVLTNLKDADLDNYTKNIVYSSKTINQVKNRTNVYKLNLDMLDINKLENYILANVPKDFTVTKISVDYILMNNTKQVIVQSGQKKITEKLDVFISELEDYLVNKISDKDYLLDEQVKEHLLLNFSSKYIKTNYNKCVNTVCTKLKLNRTYLTLALREQLHVDLPLNKSRLKIIYYEV